MSHDVWLLEIMMFIFHIYVLLSHEHSPLSTCFQYFFESRFHSNPPYPTSVHQKQWHAKALHYRLSSSNWGSAPSFVLSYEHRPDKSQWIGDYYYAVEAFCQWHYDLIYEIIWKLYYLNVFLCTVELEISLFNAHIQKYTYNIN